jgi:cytochrome P450
MSIKDAEIDEFLNGIVVKLYARARSPSSGAANTSMRLIDDPVQVDAILKAPDRFRKNYSLLSLLGSSRFSANGAEWEQRRQLTQPGYLEAAKTGNRDSIQEIYQAELSACDTTPVAIQKALLTAAITVFFRALGCEADAGALLAFFSRIRPILKRAQYLSWAGGEDSERSQVAAQAAEALRQYLAAAESSPDLVDLMDRFRQQAAAIPHFVPHEELLMNFFAGIETSAATLGWAITCLAPDGRVQERVYKEAIAGQEDTPYLDCFVNETMRYFPAVPFVIRQVASPITFAGAELQPNSLLMLSVVGVHHHPRYWKEPDVFDTARSEFLENSFDRRAFIPFLTGPRMCGGARLARLEIVEGLKAFLRSYEVSGGTEEFSFDYGLAMRSNSWSRVEIRRRH